MTDDYAIDVEDDEMARSFIVYGPDNRPRLLRERCSSCIMRSPGDGQIDVPAETIRLLIAEALDAEAFVICHSTIYRDDVEPAICRGFADTYSTNHLRIIRRIGGFTEVEPPSQEGGFYA
jgi:hypothetical protein